MKARTWSIISILSLIGAAVFWKLGNRVREQHSPPPPPLTARSALPANTTLVSKAALASFTEPPTSSPTVSAASSQDQTDSNSSSESFPDPQFPWRLRNTPAQLSQLRKSDTAILLRNALIDTSRGTELPIPKELRAGSEPGAWLVQFHGPTRQAFLKEIQRVGLTPVSYIPNHTWLVKGSSAQAQAAKQLPAVRAVLPYEPYFKLQPKILQAVLQTKEPVEGLRITAFPDAKDSLFQALQELNLPVQSAGQTPFGPQFLIPTTLTPEQVAAIARLPETQLLEPLPQRVLMNDLTRVRLGICTSPVDTNSYLGLTGSNIWVNINDTGVDANHPDLQGRVFGDSPAVLTDPLGHGTHVAGTIAGSGEKSDTVTNMPPGSLPNSDFRGMAPNAKLFVLGVDLVTGPWISDTYLQETAARTNYVTLGRTNAMVSNNSWGYTGLYDYDTAAASYDAAVRDALPEEPGQQPLIYVFAAGDEGDGNQDGLGGEPDTITSPGTAKNVITVGAIENLRFLTNTVVVTNQDQTVTNSIFYKDTDSDSEIAWFSGRGNVGVGIEGDTGRFKPDLVAPGTFIVSARSTDWDLDSLQYGILRNVLTNQTIARESQNQYSVYVPRHAKKLEITIQTNIASPSPMPDLKIFVQYGVPPNLVDLGTNAVVGTNSVTVADPSPGTWFYVIENPTLTNVVCDIITQVRVQLFDDTYRKALQEANDALGPYYRFDSGTSCAAAAISGMLALIQEYFENILKEPYSPALLKALLINRAHSVSPAYTLQVHKQLNYQGWGLPELPLVLPAVLTNTTDRSSWPIQWVDQSPTNSLTTGQVHEYKVTLPEEAQQGDLKVTLVWTDPPGNPAASYKLVNDLDLIVSNVVTGEICVGNDIPEGSDYNVRYASTNTTDLPFDRVNNVENVLIRHPLDTEYVVYVVAHQVNVNAVTAHPDGIAQDYALVVSVTAPVGITLEQQSVSTNVVAAGPVDVITNGIPKLYERVGANSPLRNPPVGETNQWRFYVFTNTPLPGAPSSLTNGPYVAFITFTPPNLSVPRQSGEADIDLYVTRGDPGLLTLDPVSLETAYKSISRGGTEMVAFTNAEIGEVFYVGVKAEDQMASEFSLVGLSSVEPFGYINEEGNLVLQGFSVPAAIPDGSPMTPGAAEVFAVGIYPMEVGRVTVHAQVFHESMGDLYGELYHSGQFAALFNHPSANLYTNGILDEVYDDSLSGESPLARPTDGPGSLLDFMGYKATGPWIFTVIDNALEHTGRIENLTIEIRPNPNLLLGFYGSVLPNQFDTFYLDVPPDATKMRIILSSLTGPLNVYVRHGQPPTFTDYDKAAFLVPVGGELDLSINDSPPLQPGRYYISLFNPGAVPVEYHIRVEFERNLNKVLAADYTDSPEEEISDDARLRLTNHVDSGLLVSEVQVGLRVDHPRVSDLAFHLISPYGTRVLLVENRGGTNATRLGQQTVTTNFYHVAVTYDRSSGEAGLYLNGQLLTMEAIGSLDLDTRGNLYIGHQPLTNRYSGQLYGGLDEVALFGRALLPSEIRGLYKFGPQAIPLDSLISRWPLDGSGVDTQGPNNATVTGGLYKAGQFDQGLWLSKEGDGLVITNVAGLDVGKGNGWTWEAWISPEDLTTNIVLAVWSDGTNHLGVEIGLMPNPTNDAPPLLYANLRDRTGADHLVQIPSPGIQSEGNIITNITYLTLTDDTNLALVPIKFADLAITNEISTTNLLLGGFESVSANPVTILSPGQYIEGWLVETNPVKVFHDPTLAHTGTNLLVLANGALTTNLTTVPGVTYELHVVHRAVPTFGGMVVWWPGALDPNTGQPLERIHGLQATQYNITIGSGLVEEAFEFSGPGSYIEVPDSPFLDLTNEFTIEFWFRLDPGTKNVGLLAKRETQDPYRANYGVSVVNGRLLFWFNDPNREAPETDQPGSGYEAVNVGPAPADGSFHHFAVTVRQAETNQVEVFAFLDGTQQASRVLSCSLADVATDTPLILGATMENGADGLQGALDEVTIYNRALGAEEIQQIYQLNAVGKGLPQVPPETAVVAPEASAELHFVSGPQWQTNTLRFVALTNEVAVQIYAVRSGAMLDSIELQQTPTTYFLPEEPLKPFIGQRAAGDWILEVTDRRVGPTNETQITPNMISWKLSLKFAPPTIPAVGLTNGVPYTNTINQGEARYFYVDVPRSATRATNTLTADLPLDLWFNQDGLPQFSITNNDILLLRGTTNGTVVIATNGTTWLSPTNTVLSNAPLPELKPGQRYYLAITNAGPPTQFVLRVDFDALDTNIFGLTDLPAGTTITTNIAPGNLMQFYRCRVSQNAVAATFEVVPQDGNVNLYVRRAEPVPDPLPRPQVYDYASENPGTQPEVILVTTNSSPVPLTPGDWYLGVLNLETNTVHYSIRFTEQLVSPVSIVDLDFDQPTNQTANPAPPFLKFFHLLVTNDLPGFEIQVWNVDQPVVLYARKDALPNNVTFDRLDRTVPGYPARLILRTNALMPSLTGDWYVAVVPQTNTTVHFTIEARHLPTQPVIQDLPPDTPILSTLGADTFGAPLGLDYYRIRLPNDAVQATIMVQPLTGNVDVYLKRGLPLPDPTQFDYQGVNLGLAPEVLVLDTNSFPVPIQGGDWYVAVRNMEVVSTTYQIFLTVQRGQSPNQIVLDKNIIFQNGALVLRWTAPPGLVFRVEYATEIPTDGPIQWKPLPGTITSTTGQYEFQDDGSQSGGFGKMKIYRVVLVH